ncbi:MAG TPA: cytochrome c biogenesis heme-transporting ATPase CcmA [Steroidobacteraceae bacterium]
MNDITAENLHLWRGEVHVLRGLSFVLDGGECLQVTGVNGSGKTTLLRALCGLVPLEQGRICWRGADIRADLSAYHGELAYLGHDNGLKGELTPLENLRFGLGLRRRVSAAQCRAALALLGLTEPYALPLRQLSAGQRRRVALARLYLTEAPLWVLDEPGSNLDASGQATLAQLLAGHLRGGRMAVVATHQPLDLSCGTLRSVALQ